MVFTPSTKPASNCVNLDARRPGRVGGVSEVVVVVDACSVQDAAMHDASGGEKVQHGGTKTRLK